MTSAAKDSLNGRKGRTARTARRTRDFLKAFFLTPAARSITARTLVKLIHSMLRLHPVALAAQFVGMVSLLGLFWESGMSQWFLVVWAVLGLIVIYMSLLFARNFWRDRERVARVRIWIRRWTWLAFGAGLVWGIAGAVFPFPVSGVTQVTTVAVIVAVTFASWPVYACWMPSLTAFTLLSLAPLTVAVAVQYSVSRTLISVIIVAVTVFIFYCGRRLSEMVVSSILTDAENQRLVLRLRTEIHRAQNARRAAEAESAKRARFFAAANHDLRQPLQAMGIYLDILQRRTTPQTAPVVQQLTAVSTSISTLVEQVLEVTRMEFGRVEIHVEDVAVADVLGQLQEEFAPQAAKAGLQFHTATRLPPDATVRTDRQLLLRGLRNFLTNALRYTAEGEVVLGARRFDGRIVFGVYDSGPGMSAEETQRIFETFYRGRAGMDRPGSGFGLGLSIVKGLAKQLDWKISVGSRPGRGSVFRIAVTPGGAGAALPGGRPARRALETIRAHAALLEDNPTVREALAATLRSWGADVVDSGTPDETTLSAFLAHAEEAEGTDGKPFVLITDYNFGEDEPTGIEFAARLERLVGRAVPTVVVTAVAADLIEADLEELRQADGERPEKMPQVLQKPVTPDVLNQAVAALLREAEAEAAKDREASEAPDAPHADGSSEDATEGAAR